MPSGARILLLMAVILAVLLGLGRPATARPADPIGIDASALFDPMPTGSPSASPPVDPAPTPTALPTPTPFVGPATASLPDRFDRAWPKNPPWDACPRPVWPGVHSDGLPGGGRRVLVIGDSLTRDSRELTAKGMRTAGWTPSFRCWGSRRLDWGIDQVSRARGLRQLPGFIIVALGTNDISWETPTTTERRVRSLLDRLGPDRQVIWVNLHLTRSAWLDARAMWFNDLLRRVERQRPNLTVVEWHRVARAHRIHGWDGIHYGPYGYRLRAQTVMAALNAVGRANPAPTPEVAESTAASLEATPVLTDAVAARRTRGLAKGA